MYLGISLYYCTYIQRFFLETILGSEMKGVAAFGDNNTTPTHMH